MAAIDKTLKLVFIKPSSRSYLNFIVMIIDFLDAIKVARGCLNVKNFIILLNKNFV